MSNLNKVMVVQGWRQNLRADGWVLEPLEYHFSMGGECDVVSGPLSIGHLFQVADAKEGSMRKKSISPCLSEPASQ